MYLYFHWVSSFLMILSLCFITYLHGHFKKIERYHFELSVNNQKSVVHHCLRMNTWNPRFHGKMADSVNFALKHSTDKRVLQRKVNFLVCFLNRRSKKFDRKRAFVPITPLQFTVEGKIELLCSSAPVHSRVATAQLSWVSKITWTLSHLKGCLIHCRSRSLAFVLLFCNWLAHRHTTMCIQDVWDGSVAETTEIHALCLNKFAIQKALPAVFEEPH